MSDLAIPAADKVEQLAERLANVATTPDASSPIGNTSGLPRPLPLVQAALATSAAKSAKAARNAPRRRSITSFIVDGFVAACSFFPYALVALALRLVVARVFFLAGQAQVDGFHVPLTLRDFEFSMIVPTSVKPQAYSLFLAKLSETPIPPMLAAYVVSYAEFILPILIVLGFATRLSALVLLAITVAMQAYLLPADMWAMNATWASMLLVLLSLGPGQISVDHVIRFIARK